MLRKSSQHLDCLPMFECEWIVSIHRNLMLHSLHRHAVSNKEMTQSLVDTFAKTLTFFHSYSLGDGSGRHRITTDRLITDYSHA